MELGHALALARLVGVTDGGHAREVGCLDVGEGITNEGGGGGVGVQAADCLIDQVRAGLE